MNPAITTPVSFCIANRWQGWRGVCFLLFLFFASPLLGADGQRESRKWSIAQREGTEWDIAYWYNANDDKLPRVLLLGDSICNGYSSDVRDDLAGVAYVSYWATSKSITDPSYFKELTYILGEYPYAVIHFNTGLHSLYANLKTWGNTLRKVLALIREKDPNAKIIWASCTPLKDAKLTIRVRRLNQAASRFARENGLPIDDLFALMDPLNRDTNWTDTYHFNAEARKRQAKQVGAYIRKALGGKTATKAEARAALQEAASETGPNGPIVTGSNAAEKK
jgi:GDSL-like Lipase/Acylhydrolase family